MHHFAYRGGMLHAEDCAIADIAAEVGTPFYCYSAATLRRHYRVFAKAFRWNDPLVAYSVKANSNLAVLRLLAKEGAGADVVSGGELARAVAAGIHPEKIVYSGVGKTREEMRAALEAGIGQFNVESEPELEALAEVAAGMGARAPVAIRVNPDVAAGGHQKISTGTKETKFGVPWSRAEEVYARAHALEGVEVVGVDVHIGSQITDLAPFEAAFKKVAELVRTLRAAGCTIDRVDLGGGLGIPYGEIDAAAPPGPDAYAEMIRRIAEPLGVRLIFEPGRMIVGNAGVLVSRVVYVKEGEEKRFVILDAGMNDLIRPALYDAWHEILPVTEAAPETPRTEYDVVGPVCETGDLFARARRLPQLAAGDLVAFMSAGAYSAVQASEYNSRPLAPEVLVDGARRAVVRARPTYAEMIARDRAPDWL